MSQETKGQILWSGTITVSKPRFHAQVLGIYGISPEDFDGGDEPDPFDEYIRLVELEDSIQGS